MKGCWVELTLLQKQWILLLAAGVFVKERVNSKKKSYRTLEQRWDSQTAKIQTIKKRIEILWYYKGMLAINVILWKYLS